MLQEAEVKPERIFERAGLDLATFGDPDHRIPFDAAGRLLEECATATGNSSFGLSIAARFDLSSLGEISHLMRNAPNLGAALISLVRHLHLHDRGAVPFLLDLGQQQMALGYAVYRHDTPGIAHVYDVAVAIGCSMMRTLCGPGWKPVRVSLSHGAPRDAASYRRYFKAPVHFNSPHSELVFAAYWLEKPIAGADPARRAAAEQVALRKEHFDGELYERVQRTVRGLVMTGGASSERVAEQLGINERVLRRRLFEEGMKLSELIGSARFEVARQLLRDTQLSLSEVAGALHYSDATAFSRAFRGWAGMTPSAWRARSRAPAPIVNTAD
ncbi:MAG TPA: AraC family transcriptional regulator [Casimicrobiaceae bacterium]|nr:AraC family transcriptional regulator [Casimicrobiaceae bacterium]